MNRLQRVLPSILCFLLGTLLLLAPWSYLWERNLLLDRYPGLIPVLLNSYLRGAVSGLGLLDIWIAATLLRRPRTARAAAP